MSGEVTDNTVYEAMVYIHTADYNFESTTELGLWGLEKDAKAELLKYCRHNKTILNASGLVVEKIINKCVIGRREWSEGFQIYTYIE